MILRKLSYLRVFQIKNYKLQVFPRINLSNNIILNPSHKKAILKLVLNKVKNGLSNTIFYKVL